MGAFQDISNPFQWDGHNSVKPQPIDLKFCTHNLQTIPQGTLEGFLKIQKITRENGKT